MTTYKGFYTGWIENAWRSAVPVTIFEIKPWNTGCAYEIGVGYFDENPNKVGEIPIRSRQETFIARLEVVAG